MENLEEIPTENIEVQKQPTKVESKVGSKEFCEELTKEFSSGKIWRSSKALAEKMGVDVIEMDDFLRKQHGLCSRPSKEEGIVFYASLKRVDKADTANKNEEVEKTLRPLVSEEDRYALASLHSALIILDATLHKYAMKIHERIPEAFTQLASGKDKIEAGIALYGRRLRAEMSKLPKV